MFTCGIDLSEFHRKRLVTISTLRLSLSRAARIAAESGVAEAKASGRFKNRTGDLRSGIKAKEESYGSDGSSWSIVSSAKYSQFIENGTRPHRIEPKNGVALKWSTGGSTHFAQWVDHPGTKADPFMRQAGIKAESILRRELEAITVNLQKIWV